MLLIKRVLKENSLDNLGLLQEQSLQCPFYIHFVLDWCHF